MKNRYTAGFLGLFLVCCIVTKAQEPIQVKQHTTDKPFLFSQLPDRSDCITEELIQLCRAKLFAIGRCIDPDRRSFNLLFEKNNYINFLCPNSI